MNAVLNIRAYIPEDKEELLQIIRTNTPTYFAQEEEADFADYLENEREDYFVVESGGKIVGCGGVNYSEDRSVGIISWGMIHPDFHGKKIGTALLKYRIDVLKNTPGVNRITVRTSQLTYPFYEKNGFRLIETKKDFWAPGLDMCFMNFEF